MSGGRISVDPVRWRDASTSAIGVAARRGVVGAVASDPLPAVQAAATGGSLAFGADIVTHPASRRWLRDAATPALDTHRRFGGDQAPAAALRR